MNTEPSTTDFMFCYNCQKFNRDSFECSKNKKKVEKTHTCIDFEESISVKLLDLNKIKQDFEELKTKVISLLLQKKTNEASEIIAQHIMFNEHIKTTRNDNQSEMWFYSQGIYIPNGESYITEIARKILQDGFTTYRCNQIIAKIRADTYVDSFEFFNQSNKHIYLIPVENGILNIKTKKIEPFRPDIYFFNKLSMMFVPGVDCPNVKKFIKSILPDEEHIYNTIQELFGFVLLKEYKYEKSFMFEGAGRNGKGKLLSLIQNFVGSENCANISLLSLEKDDNFSISYLQNKFVNISGDLSKQALNNTGYFKMLTGRDKITANRKFKNQIDFTNYAKMIFSANELPFVSDVSDGFWLRWILINFPYQFIPKKEYDSLTKEEKENCRIQNPDILSQITTPKEMQGLLNWALEGFKRLEEQMDFSYKLNKKEVKISWLRKSNSILAFVDDCCIESYEHSISKKSFRYEYGNYCRKHKLNPLSDKAIKMTLTKEYNISESYSSDLNGREWVWSGIKFNYIVD